MSAETMEAGREMDVLIAERVMGLSPVRIITVIDDEIVEDWGTMCEVVSDGATTLPFYSTNIAAAWQVVENLREQVGKIEITWLPIMRQWEVWIPAKEVCLSAESAPLALCRAALAATETTSPDPTRQRRPA